MRQILLPSQTRTQTIVLTVIAVLIGCFATLLGAVTHTGGMDGGATGLVVSLLALGVGAAAFMTAGGLIPWLGYSFAVLGTFALIGTVAGDGDQIGTIYQDLSATWNWWVPPSVFIGGLAGIIVAWVCGKGYSEKTLSDNGVTVEVNNDEGSKSDGRI